MADTISKEKRSENMSAIKSRDTNPEVYLRKKLFACGLRYRKNSASIFGHPDLYLAKYKTAVFVNGCYWHRHSGCKFAYMPKSRVEFWNKKFADNIKRDRLVQEKLLSQNIKCLVIWECTIKHMMKNTAFENEIIGKILFFLNNYNISCEL